MRKRLLISGLATLTLVFSFMGCGNSKVQTNKEQTVIRFATWDNSKDLDFQQKLVEKFNEKNQDIKVVLEAYGDEYDTKIAAGMGSGDAPDVMYMWNYPGYYKALEPLDSYIGGEGAGYKDNFYETLWNYNKIENDIYGIPVGYTTHALFYNKDLFDANGVKYPTSDWTWNDLEEAARKITNKQDNIQGFAFNRSPDPYDFEMFLWSNNGAFSDNSGKLEGNINSDASVEVFTKFQNMEKEGIALATSKDGTEEMISGKVGMYINGFWPISSFNEAKLNYGVAQIPMFKAGTPSASILSSSGLAMSKDCKSKEKAWKFIKYWTSEELNKERIQYELPVLKSVVESEKIHEDKVKSVFYSMLEQSEGRTPTSFKTKGWSELSENLKLAFERIFNPSVYDDPKTVLDETVSK